MHRHHSLTNTVTLGLTPRANCPHWFLRAQPRIVPSANQSKFFQVTYSTYFYLFLLDKLYWVSDVKPPQNYASSFFFCIDNVIYQFILLKTHHLGLAIHAFQPRLRSSQSRHGPSIHKRTCKTTSGKRI
jgi:hypothetical protein